MPLTLTPAAQAPAAGSLTLIDPYHSFTASSQPRLDDDSDSNRSGHQQILNLIAGKSDANQRSATGAGSSTRQQPQTANIGASGLDKQQHRGEPGLYKDHVLSEIFYIILVVYMDVLTQLKQQQQQQQSAASTAAKLPKQTSTVQPSSSSSAALSVLAQASEEFEFFKVSENTITLHCLQLPLQ